LKTRLDTYCVDDEDDCDDDDYDHDYDSDDDSDDKGNFNITENNIDSQ
jgi:hypothetical protein